MNKFCFATEATYPNYTRRIKENILGDYIRFELDKREIPYIISTNRPQDFDEFKGHPFIKVFSIDELRNDVKESFEYELYPEDPKGLYPSKYPWNARRFTLRKAAELGCNSCYYFEADMKVNHWLNLSNEEFFKILNEIYSPNTLTTNTTIFRYKNKRPDDVFNYHDKYIETFGYNFQPDQYDTVDGTLQFYMGESVDALMNFYKNWNELALFGYRNSVNGDFGYKNNAHAVLSFAIPASNFTLREHGLPFFPEHHFEERY